MQPQKKLKKSKGLVAVFTGNGKGKTTAALGLAFRALGHEMNVCIIQFIKGSWKYGEIESAKQFSNLDFHIMGRGFTWNSDDIDKDIKVAREAWKFAEEVISSNKHAMVILDELTYLPHYNIIDEAEILSVLAKKPKNQHIVITGRYASDKMVEFADLVTEMTEMKHPYKNGINAQKGFEY